MASNIESKVVSLIEPIINKIGYELYDVIYEKEAKDYYLRIFIDKPEGIDINDCENVNNAINDPLDEADYIKEQYFLEVSSPGIERTLRKDRHFQSQIGKKICIKLFKPENKIKEFIGILEEYNENSNLVIRVEDTDYIIDLKNIALARTVFDW
ncbi:MAG: ribosome maturation factor RimP [Clostridia bacterium]|nr:ribosome maturation factor RimP [Clostridia bacterium]